MSLGVTKQIRGNLISSSTLTSLVPATDIKVGWVKSDDSFPCITINQVGGYDYGYLGYGTSAAGSKMRKEQVMIQLDIYSQTSRMETLQIADEIVKIMISGSSRKESDVEMYSDESGLYRKVQTYTYTHHWDD